MIAPARDFSPQPIGLTRQDDRPACDDFADNVYFERRAAERHPCNGHVTALVSGPGFTAPRNRICSLQLQNISDSGMAGVSTEPLPIGAQITVFIAPHGAERGYDLHGTVVRCFPQRLGQQIGIRFRGKMAA